MEHTEDNKLEEHTVTDLYDGVRGLAVKILNRVERTDAYLEKLLDNEMRDSELIGADKALLYSNIVAALKPRQMALQVTLCQS